MLLKLNSKTIVLKKWIILGIQNNLKTFIEQFSFN